ncbi:MAG: cysteine--tRNA ligase [Verrucomicrobiota bacterium JB022]|nr:cysteine--tRNA ligase [Verrucomicrobiota bacterium JB022]
MVIKLHDTLSREVKALEKRAGERYQLYVCGPTVYGPAHIGNFITFTRFDVLYRTLQVAGYEPYYVRNITDVDDKTIRRSLEEGLSLLQFTQRWTDKFHEDCGALNLLTPDVEPRATDHIKEQIELVEELLKKGHAYVGGDGSVYYRVTSFADYGKLAHFDPEQLRSQDTNSAGTANLADEYEREAVADFALWKAHKTEDGPNLWQGPKHPETGKEIAGRPGWHLECSAMSMRYLGPSFDLHGGGEDLCFPHHENEIAQSEAATGQPFCRHWMHSTHLLVEGKKMSKSLGNFFTIDDLLEKGYSPAAIRLAFLQGHYRQQFNFTLSGIAAAQSGLEKLEKGLLPLLEKSGMSREEFGQLVPPFAGDLGEFENAWKALCHDLNTPAALGSLFSAVKRASKRIESADEARAALQGAATLLYALGIPLFTAKEEEPEAVEVPAEIAELAEKRWQAKQSRDFAAADALRAELTAKGWQILDRKDGYDVVKG